MEWKNDAVLPHRQDHGNQCLWWISKLKTQLSICVQLKMSSLYQTVDQLNSGRNIGRYHALHKFSLATISDRAICSQCWARWAIRMRIKLSHLKKIIKRCRPINSFFSFQSSFVLYFQKLSDEMTWVSIVLTAVS